MDLLDLPAMKPIHSCTKDEMTLYGNCILGYYDLSVVGFGIFHFTGRVFLIIFYNVRQWERTHFLFGWIERVVYGQIVFDIMGYNQVKVRKKVFQVL